MFSLKSKNILITGAAGLIGQQFSNSLLNAGAKCYLVDLDKNKLIRKFKKNSSAKLFSFDLTNFSELKKFKSKLDKSKIFIDTIINNAANNHSFNEKVSLWENDLELNLTSVKNIIDIFSVNMKRKRKGNIINIGSDLSVIAPDQRLYSHMNYQKPVSYSVTKHGIIGMTKYYAALLAKYNIRVNSLSPGGILNNQDKKFVLKLKKLIPLNRMAQKDDYNGAIIFMCSDATKYMTGHNLVIDGGRSII